MKDIETKREREKKMISQMIALYCRRNHHTKGVLCPECAALNDYARARSEHCPFMVTKTFCVNCRVHCYKPDMREKIRAVMRFSGPRMIFYHPVAAIRHVVETKREKRDWREKTDEVPNQKPNGRWPPCQPGFWRSFSRGNGLPRQGGAVPPGKIKRPGHEAGERKPMKHNTKNRKGAAA